MHYLRKRELERTLGREAGLYGKTARHVVSIVARSLKRWNYQPPTQEVEQGFLDLDAER